MWIWNIPKCGCHISLSRPALARPLVVSCQARWTVNVKLSYQVDSRWSKVQLKGFGILKFETLMRRQSLWTPEWRQKPCEGRCLAGESTWPCQCVCQDTWYFYYPLDSTLFGSFAPTLPGIPLSDLHQGNECVQMGKGVLFRVVHIRIALIWKALVVWILDSLEIDTAWMQDSATQVIMNLCALGCSRDGTCLNFSNIICRL